MSSLNTLNLEPHQVSNQLLVNAASSPTAVPLLSDAQTLRALYALHDRVFLSAIDIITTQSERIVRVVANESGRQTFVVGSHHVLHPHFCSCSAFRFTVVQKGNHFKCKHQLALEMALVMEQQQAKVPASTPDDVALGGPDPSASEALPNLSSRTVILERTIDEKAFIDMLSQ